MKIKCAKTGNKEVSFLTYQWFKSTVAHHVNVSGSMLKAQDMKFAAEVENGSLKPAMIGLNRLRRGTALPLVQHAVNVETLTKMWLQIRSKR